MTNIAAWQVILVDDEPDSLELISEVLAYEGAVVYRAASGDECLVLLQQVAPTLMVVDLQMPEPNGWDLLAYVRSNSQMQDVLMVATTAYHTPIIEQQAYEMGFNAYIPKPLRSQQLMAVLKELVG